MVSTVKRIASLALALIGTSVNADHFNAPTKLREGHGYLLLAIESLGIPPKKILLRGPKVFSTLSFDEIRSGTNYRKIPVPEGRYYFSQIHNGEGKTSSYWDILSFDYYVDVKANTTSYAGHLISEMYSDQSVDFNLRNRSSQAFAYFQNCCQALNKTYPLTYTGSYPDPFLDFLIEKTKNQ